MEVKELKYKIISSLEPLVKNMSSLTSWIVKKILVDKDKVNYLTELLKSFEWKSVAIVWNSPILNNNNYWKSIDNYDIIIRFNKWILENFLVKADTWLKTTLYSTWPL